MNSKDIIVIGASAGGFDALKKLVAGFSKDLNAAIFVVWHIPASAYGVLPKVLEKEGVLPAAHAVDGEEIQMGRIYVAPPDHHLVIEGNKVRTTKGPKENRFRPAVDPLFRSAAFSFGPRVIGVILSGALDDGTAGLWTIKQRGGTAVVQDPAEAETPSMPMSALREVDVDYCVSVSEMAGLLTALTKEKVSDENGVSMEENEKTEIEVRIAAHDTAFERGVMKLGDVSPFTCPDCNGVLIKLKDGKLTRFRCHTGHAFSADSLLATVSESIESSMWNAMRAIEESIMLLNHMSEHFADSNQGKLSEMSRMKACEAEQRAQIIRQAIMEHELLSEDRLRYQAGNGKSPA